jgi:hypothetical protein
MVDKKKCSLAKGFSIYEKMYAQVSFFAFCIIGFYGIYIQDWRWSVVYLIICTSVPLIVQRYLVCPRCPHLYEYGDCLQLHPKLTRLLIKKQIASPMNRLEKSVWILIFILLPVFPIYWLVLNKALLIAFLLACGIWYGGQFFYFCKRCRVYSCPLNRTPYRC